jgi:hypothetical protein
MINEICNFRFVRHETDAGDGWERSEICEMLKEKIGEKNPDVKV